MTPSESSRKKWHKSCWLLDVQKLQFRTPSVFYLRRSQIFQSIPFFAQPRCWIPTPPITAIPIGSCWPCVTFHQRNPLFSSTDMFDMMNDRILFLALLICYGLGGLWYYRRKHRRLMIPSSRVRLKVFLTSPGPRLLQHEAQSLTV